MFDKFVKSAEDLVAERISSPILGPFAISWCLWNYKYLIILMSQNSVSESFNLADRLLYPDWWHLWGMWLLLPAITTLAYIYVYPIAVEKVLSYSLTKKANIDALRRKHDDGTIMPYEEGRRLKAGIREMETEHSAELVKKDTQIKRLQSMLDAERERKNTPDQTKQPVQKLSSLHRGLLVIISQHNGTIKLDQLSTATKMKLVELEFNMQELEDAGFVSSMQGMEDMVYSLTQLGRAVALGKGAAAIKDE